MSPSWTPSESSLIYNLKEKDWIPGDRQSIKLTGRMTWDLEELVARIESREATYHRGDNKYHHHTDFIVTFICVPYHTYVVSIDTKILEEADGKVSWRFRNRGNSKELRVWPFLKSSVLLVFDRLFPNLRARSWPSVKVKRRREGVRMSNSTFWKNSGNAFAAPRML